MRAKQEVLRVWCAFLATVVVSTSCMHAAANGSQSEMRRFVHDGEEIEVDAAIDDVIPLLEKLSNGGMSVSAVWKVPGAPPMRLALVEKPGTEKSYGLQLIAINVTSETEVSHESPRLYDDNFVHPTFFRFADRTLVLADHGSEDAYGVLAWSIEKGRVRDLGQLQIALPEGQDVFTRGAAPTARVELRGGKYRIEIPGPVLLNPQGEEERLLAKQGEVVTFRESAGRFEIERR